MRSGDVIADRYEVSRLADEGGMGVVYQGVDRQTSAPVAIKVLHARGSDSAARFAREAEVLADLHHPGIVRHITHGQTEDRDLYLVMEWLEGIDLAKRLKRQGISIAESVTLAAATAEALGAIHTMGVVHRDVKPSNLFLVNGDVSRVKLLDFGVARLTEATITMSGITFGTPGYMAPEQARGDRRLDARADVFALGCVLFECLTGRPAFQGEHLMAILAKILLEDAPRVRELNRDVPQSLDRLVACMLLKDPAQRPADGRALAAELSGLGPLNAPLSTSLPPEPSITPGEQRLLCVVLAGAPSPTQTSPTLKVEVLPRETAMTTETDGTMRSTSADADATVRDRAPGASDEVRMAEPGKPLRPSASARLDARQALSPEMQERLRDAAAICDARVECLADGSVIATLTGSKSATDQVAQAARLALNMHLHLAGAPVVVTTGRGVLSGKLPVGDAIDRAAALMRDTFDAGAHERGVVVDDVTAGLLDERFEVSRADRAVLVLLRERDLPEARRTLLGKSTPLVGRDRELLTLEAIYAESIEESVARAVVVTAPAGAGKSRLCYEFVRKVSERETSSEVWIGRGDPLSAGSPFGLIARALRRPDPGLEVEPPDARRRRLRARVAQTVPPEDTERVSEFLGELVGVPFPDEDSVQLRAARQDAMLMGDQMRRAWEDFLAAECKSRPVLLVLEDLHWGDLPSVKLVDAALRHLKDQPFMVLALARPEVHEMFPQLWVDRSVAEIRLGELSRRASEKLIRHLLGPDVPGPRLEEIAHKAGGNAFFLEEILRAIIEGREAGLPETVLAVVQARLEALTAEARWALRAASVFGQVFWRGGVSQLLGGAGGGVDLSRCLAELVEREVIVRRANSRFAGEDEMMFQHSFLREAAYSMLTDEDRRLGHRIAADWLERAGETDAMVLAEHFERGGQSQLATTWFHKAAEHALEGNDFEAALSRAERGIEGGPPPSTRAGDEREVVGQLRLLQAEAHRWRGEHAPAFDCASEALRRLPHFSAKWFLAAGELAMAAGRLARFDELLRLAADLDAPVEEEASKRAFVVAAARAIIALLYADRREAAQALIERIGHVEAAASGRDPVVAAAIHRVHATKAVGTGDSSAYLAGWRAAAANYELAGDLRNVCNAHVGSGHALLKLGMYEQAIQTLRDALATAERYGLPSLIALARHNLGLALARHGDVEAGAAEERAAATLFADHGDRRLEAASLVYLAQIALLGDRAEDGLGALERALELSSDIGGLRAHARAVRAEILLRLGDTAAAREAAQQASLLLAQLGHIEEGDALIRLLDARTLDAVADHEGAVAAIRAARARVLERAQEISDEEARTSFLERIPEHAATQALAASWLGEP